jgi:Flp pilus assembly protein TadG
MRPSAHRNPSRCLRSQSGQAIVEFALVLPILLIIVFGVIDFARAYTADDDVTSAAGAGARYAAVGTWPGGATLKTYIGTLLKLPSWTANPQVNICLPDGNPGVGHAVRVDVTAQYSILPVSFGGDSPLTVTLRGTSVARLEQAVTSSTFSGDVTSCPT